MIFILGAAIVELCFDESHSALVVNMAVNFIPLDLTDERIVFGFISIENGRINQTLESKLIKFLTLSLLLAFK